MKSARSRNVPPIYSSSHLSTIAQAMRIKLTSIDPWARQDRIVVEKLPAVVGRAADADVCLADQWVSRNHCEIYELKGTLAVRDLGSRHGTFVNGLRVRETILLPGNRLSLGMTTLKVDYKRQAAKGLSVDTQAETARVERQTSGIVCDLDAEQAPPESPTALHESL